MDIEILISTMNKKNILDLELEKKGIKKNCLIINQVTDEKINLVNEEIIDKNIRMFSFKEKGLSKSRNRALELAKGNLCIIADDDLTYDPLIFNKIKKIFDKNLDCGIITFKYRKEDERLNKKYKNIEFTHNLKSLLRVSSVETVIRIDKIKENKIKFDENFGLGAKFNSGEENIFLTDCYKSKIKIKYFPLIIVKHPNFSSGQIFNRDTVYGKAALFYRIFGEYSYIILSLFLLKKCFINKININFIEILKQSYKGVRDYKKLINLN